ncbi:MAG: GLPGLI family protein [Prevotellaceae bacterium]|jgi:GLPGLI family protein|nr:GLPGLI family protein [Prevotellaceae bacterium]
MKKNFCLLFLLCAFGIVRAEEWKKIDVSSMQFIYNYQFYEEHKNPSSVKSCVMLLEVGKLYSKFYSSSRAYADSLVMLYANEPPQVAANKILPQISGLREHGYCRHYVFKNYPSQGRNVFLGSAFGDFYRVEEKLQFDWEIDNGAQKVILGMNYIKATCRYAGRDYEAWFTPDIPISDGPYKFSGLPGLIVKLQDSDEEHIFELQEVRKVNNKPMYFPAKTYTSTSARGYTRTLEAAKAPLIEQLQSATYSDPEMLTRAIARVQRQNNFIERY